MTRPITARTYAPIRLADLDPHRFEDLVRNLAYDFRRWASIEAVGRAGDDSGFDVRAWESFYREADAEELGEDSIQKVADRQWMFQCKREQNIGPRKLEKYLRQISFVDEQVPYGIVFVGSCDFSKSSQDLFISVCREIGFQEAYLWGRGEVEDQLFQPKNDNLLFAFFGISLATRRRSTKTDIRNKLVPKRKITRILKEGTSAVLLRDALDVRYPFAPDDLKEPWARWLVLDAIGPHHDGLRLKWLRYPAFVGADGKSWDVTSGYNFAIPGGHENPWEDKDIASRTRGSEVSSDESMKEWRELEDNERAWFELSVVVPYESIIEIDEHGDDVFEGPHLYLELENRDHFPLREYHYRELRRVSDRRDRRSCDSSEEHRVAKFKHFRWKPL